MTRNTRSFGTEANPEDDTRFSRIERVLGRSQVIVPGETLLNSPDIGDAPSSRPSNSTTTLPQQPPRDEGLVRSGVFVINGLLIASVASMMYVRRTLPPPPPTAADGSVVADGAGVIGGGGEEIEQALGVFVTFLVASAIYISPSLRAYVPPVVRILGGFMIGVVFSMSIKYLR